MSRLLLDTTFLIDVERTGDDLGAVIADDDDVAIAAVTVAELRAGAPLARGGRRTARSAYVDDIVATVPVLGYDVAVAQAHAELLGAVPGQATRGPRPGHRRHGEADDRTVVSTDRGAFHGLPGIEVRSRRWRVAPARRPLGPCPCERGPGPGRSRRARARRVAPVARRGGTPGGGQGIDLERSGSGGRIYARSGWRRARRVSRNSSGISIPRRASTSKARLTTVKPPTSSARSRS